MSPRWRSSLCCALVVGRAAACPCSDDAGSSSSLTRADELYAAALVATSRRALGRFDALGRYSALESSENETSEELLLRAALRSSERLEWLGELGYAAYRFHTPSVSERQVGVGDALVHVRYVVRRESMPHERWWLPGVAAFGLARAPLGSMTRAGATGFGSGGAQLGLGTWEVGAGGEARLAPWPAIELLFAGEAAYRFADQVLGRRRHLGPRVEAALGLRALPLGWLAASIALRARATGDVALDERRLPGTSERLWTLVLGAAFYDATTRLRSSVTLSVDPPFAGLSQGATAATALSVSVGYGAR